MKTRTRPSVSPHHSPTGASISHQGSFLALLGAGLRQTADALIESIGARVRRRSHLRLIRRNGRAIPVPLRVIVKTRNLRIGSIVFGILLTLSLAAAGIGAGIYLDRHMAALPSAATK